ncbi:hypothetical protein B0H34DRAFT_669656 [Crassisporium funariophilum]|nr:hypothetical protein B0H34DRAFT_669656 [Crassisporium funariophilum]
MTDPIVFLSYILMLLNASSLKTLSDEGTIWRRISYDYLVLVGSTHMRVSPVLLETTTFIPCRRSWREISLAVWHRLPVEGHSSPAFSGGWATCSCKFSSHLTKRTSRADTHKGQFRAGAVISNFWNTAHATHAWLLMHKQPPIERERERERETSKINACDEAHTEESAHVVERWKQLDRPYVVSNKQYFIVKEMNHAWSARQLYADTPLPWTKKATRQNFFGGNVGVVSLQSNFWVAIIARECLFDCT